MWTLAGLEEYIQWWIPGQAPKIKLINRSTSTKSIDAGVQVATAYATNCDDMERVLLIKESVPSVVEPEPPLPPSPDPETDAPDDRIDVNEINTGPLSCSARATLLRSSRHNWRRVSPLRTASRCPNCMGER